MKKVQYRILAQHTMLCVLKLYTHTQWLQFQNHFIQSHSVRTLVENGGGRWGGQGDHLRRCPWFLLLWGEGKPHGQHGPAGRARAPSSLSGAGTVGDTH